MKAPNISPSPWTAYPPNKATDTSPHWEVEDTAGHTATVYGDDEEAAANAKAIAALPQLLAALVTALSVIEDLPYPTNYPAKEIADALHAAGYTDYPTCPQ